MHMGSDRVHVVMAAEERAMFRAAAERAGMTLSEWLRTAARERLARAAGRLATLQDLDAFFCESDRREGDQPEPDWDEHKAVILGSRRAGLPT